MALKPSDIKSVAMLDAWFQENAADPMVGLQWTSGFGGVVDKLTSVYGRPPRFSYALGAATFDLSNGVMRAAWSLKITLEDIEEGENEIHFALLLDDHQKIYRTELLNEQTAIVEVNVQ